MGTPIPTALLTAKVDYARVVLYNHLLNASDSNEVALARAILLVLSQEWTQSKSSVIKAYGSSQVSAPLAIEKWHDHAVERAKEIIDWETTTKARQQAYDKRRQSYEKYLDSISKKAEPFLLICQELAPGSQTMSFKSNKMTSKYMQVLRGELLAWFDRQRPTVALVRQEPKDGLVAFLRQRSDLLMLLLTTHANPKPGPDRVNSEKAVSMQIAITPPLPRRFELYPTWDAPKTLALRSLSEPERSALAVSTIITALGGLVKNKRLQYSSDRLAAIHGGELLEWDQAISSCLVLSDNRALGVALDTATKAFGSGKRPTRAMLEDVTSKIGPLVSGTPPVVPVSLEASVESLWDNIKSKYRLNAAPAFLDQYALHRILLMGIRQSHLESQMLAELAESRISSFLRTSKGRYSLGLSTPEGKTPIFVPGHAFRAGDKPPEFRNCQISDGALGYWESGTFVICAVLEARVMGSGSRELWFDPNKKLEGLSRMDQAVLRAFANREWLELQEITERGGQNFSLRIADVEAQIFQTETGSQLARDIGRLMTSAEARVNGVLTPFKLLEGVDNPVKVLALFAKGTEQTNVEYNIIQREVSEIAAQQKPLSKTVFEFEPFAISFTATELNRLWTDIRDQAARMVYCPATTNDAGSGCEPATSPADFLIYIRDLYARAVAYGRPRTANKRVLQWLRHDSQYNGFRWDILAGPIDDKWVKSLQTDDTFASGKSMRPFKSLKMVDFVADPKHPVNIKVSHFAASTDGALGPFTLQAEKTGLASLVIGDATGWAGDLMTFYDDWRVSNARKPQTGSDYCRERLCRPDDDGSFKLRDLIEDADAFNISTALHNDSERTIVQELEDLFRTGGGYTDRLSRFFAARFGTASNCSSIAKEALTTVHPTFLIGRQALMEHTPHKDLTGKLLDDFCEGFGKTLADICVGN